MLTGKREDFAHEHNRLYIDLVRADAVDYLNNYEFYRAGRVLICRSAVSA